MVQRLLVEGSNDFHFVTNLALAMKIPKVKGYETEYKYKKEFGKVADGKSGLNTELRTLLAIEGLTNIGIILDTDKKTIEQNWQSISSVLNETYKQFIPKSHNLNGTIIQTDVLKIGIWMMPNNEKEGYLEHFFEELIKKEDVFWQLTTSTTNKFIDDGTNRFAKKDKQKADVHTWLAWQKDPESPMGFSLNQNKNYFDLQSPIAIKFKNWWENTFELLE